MAEIRAARREAVANGDDVSDWDGAGRIVATALEHFGGLDVVVNNAGFVRDRMFVSATVEEWDATMKVHLRGHFCVARHAVDYWRGCAKAGKPVDARIINTSSGAGLNGSIAQSAYSAAKGGIASLTLVQAAELGRYGITANALAPAARTRMTEQAFAEKMKRPDSGFDVQDPDNIAPAVVWLGSAESRARHRLRLRARGRQDHHRRRLDRTARRCDKQARWEPDEVGAAVAAPHRAGAARRRRCTAHEHAREHAAAVPGAAQPAGRQDTCWSPPRPAPASASATAQRCLEEGARVFVSDVHERRLAEAVERLRGVEPDAVDGEAVRRHPRDRRAGAGAQRPSRRWAGWTCWSTTPVWVARLP